MIPVISSPRRFGARALLAAAALAPSAPSAPAAPAPHPIRLADTGRHLVTADGQPFFWLGDTAWELFHRLNREEAEAYLTHRAARGFTVIQAVALAELDGLNVPNAYGHRPLIDNDPLRPDIKDLPEVHSMLAERESDSHFFFPFPRFGWGFRGHHEERIAQGALALKSMDVCHSCSFLALCRSSGYCLFFQSSTAFGSRS